MKDKNGIEIKCENCDDFIPVGTNDRGCMLYEEDCENVFGGKGCVFKASREALEARIADLEKKEPKTCDDCWLQRDFGNYIPAGYCADKCAKIYNALKD